MTLILLISPEIALSESLQTALPGFVSLSRTAVKAVQAATVAEAKSYLIHHPDEASALTLILLHAETESAIVAGCQALRQDTWTAHAPLMVLLAHPQDRQAALKAGADDYLLLPLLPAEVEARLRVHLGLLDERERLHQQVLQAERLCTVGRLTATLSHEINNPMQAIQGAVMLALEELDNPQTLAAYLHLCLDESKRVVQLLNRMSQVYRPQADVRESLDLNQLLQEAITLASKELKWQKIVLQIELDPQLPRFTAVANQLHLVFLSLLLNLSDTIQAAGGGRLYLRSYTRSQAIRIEFSTDVPFDPIDALSPTSSAILAAKKADLNFNLFLSQDIIAAQGGVLEFQRSEEQTICRIELPTNHH